MSYPTLMAKKVKILYDAMDRDNYPKNSITTQFGFGFHHKNLYLRLTNKSSKFLVIINQANEWIENEDGETVPRPGYTARTHTDRRRALQRELGKATTWWNGAQHHNTSSTVFGEIPKGLAYALERYSTRSNVWNIPTQDFQAFNAWIWNQLLREDVTDLFDKKDFV